MDIRDGSIYDEEEMKALRKEFHAFLKPVEPSRLTEKQRTERKVSLHDHTSPAGRQLTSLRQVGRNEACPCGSGRKFKFCCMNV